MYFQSKWFKTVLSFLALQIYIFSIYSVRIYDIEVAKSNIISTWQNVYHVMGKLEFVYTWESERVELSDADHDGVSIRT